MKSTPPPPPGPLATLIARLVGEHHAFTRAEIARCTALIAEIDAAYGKQHPELHRLRELFAELEGDLDAHFFKEERVLFPYMVALEESAALGVPPPVPSFRSVSGPARLMEHEHEAAAAALQEMRTLTAGYAVPADGSAHFHALYAGLAALDADFQLHMRLETDELFPQAIALEERVHAA